MLVDEQAGTEVESHINKMLRIPLLRPIEERLLVERCARGDIKSRDELIKHNMRLVVNVAKSYASSGIPLEDLVQEGAIGLMLATERFDPGRNLRFSTYATQWVRQQISRAVDNKAKCIRIPSHIIEATRKIDKTVLALEEQGIEPTMENIAEHSGLSLHKVLSIKLLIPDVISLDTHLTHSGEWSPSTLGDVLADNTNKSPEQQLLDTTLAEEATEMLSSLTEKELDIIQRRFGFTGKEKGVLQQVSEEYGISHERSRLIEHSAMKKLRSCARSSRLMQKLQEAKD
jgi:RNA polymerase primary sigma factor